MCASVRQKASCASAHSASVSKPLNRARGPSVSKRSLPAIIRRPARSPSWRMSAASTSTKCWCSVSPSSTQMPASRKHTEGFDRSVTRMFPGCMSPWSRLSWKIILQTALTPMALSAALTRGSSASRFRSTSFIDAPRTKSSTSTSADVSAGRGRGKEMSSTLAKFASRRSRLSASRRMSIWLLSVFANSSTATAMLHHRAMGTRRSTQTAAPRMSSRSVATRCRAAGWMTLTATSSPTAPPPGTSLRSVARCTCATQPVPTGSRSTASVAPQSAPRLRARAAAVSSHACAGARSCRWENRSQNAAGNRSSRLDAHWASFTAVGPAVCVAQSM
mmetsp:Transcript_20751/g.71743  ORF Transcript_20751/g.71743 Transcript_20751/m.71743 type:complete len:333 (+) Transcript_20751:207-1205(+)